jgi:hypothetical protein
MILAQLVAATFVIHVAAGSVVDSPTRQLSLQQKHAVTLAYVRSATDCIVRSVATDTRFRKEDAAANLGDLIVDSMPKCLGPVRAMIDAYDRHFGEGSGEEFFMGPYLDVLPNDVVQRMRSLAD